MKQRLPLMMFASTIAAACLLAAPAARAGGIEDAFRGFIARMQAAGQRVVEAPVMRTSREMTKPEAAQRTDKLPLGEKEIAVFVEAGCRSCQTAVTELRGRGFRVEVFDLTTSALARQSFALTGAKGVPAVIHSQFVLSGYSWPVFEKAYVADIQRQGRELQGSGS